MAVYLGTDEVNVYGGQPSGAPTLQTKTKTYTPSASQQTESVTADAGYDGLDEVDITVNATPSATLYSVIPVENDTINISVDNTGRILAWLVDLGNYHGPVASQAGWVTTTDEISLAIQEYGEYQLTTKGATTYSPQNTAQTISSGTYLTGTQTIAGAPKENKTITTNGTYDPADEDLYGYGVVTVNVSGGGSSKNAQTIQSTSRTSSTSYTKLCGDLTVAKTGTYDVYWSGYRSSTSGTWGSQLYINGTAHGTVQATFTNNAQTVHLSNVSLSANDKVSVYARSRGSNYYAYITDLEIIEA